MKRLIGFPTLILGLIFLTAGSHWFPGAYTIGVILTIVSGIALVFALIITAIMGLAVARAKDLAKRR